MDDRRFDSLTRALANGGSRRTLLKGLLILGRWQLLRRSFTRPRRRAGAIPGRPCHASQCPSPARTAIPPPAMAATPVSMGNAWAIPPIAMSTSAWRACAFPTVVADIPSTAARERRATVRCRSATPRPGNANATRWTSAAVCSATMAVRPASIANVPNQTTRSAQLCRAVGAWSARRTAPARSFPTVAQELHRHGRILRLQRPVHQRYRLTHIVASRWIEREVPTHAFTPE